MILPIIVASAVSILFISDIFQPKRPSPEDELGRALTKYLKSIKAKDKK